MQQEQEDQDQQQAIEITIAIGRDPREHGPRLADAFSRGALSVDGVQVVYTGIATTPAMFEFCRYVVSPNAWQRATTVYLSFRLIYVVADLVYVMLV